MGTGERADAPDVSAIVVTYRSRDHVLGALASIDAAVAAAGCRAEVLVVDNASADGTADLVAEARSDVRLIRNPANVGFGAANNQAFEVATGRTFLLLNPDAGLEPGALGILLRFLDGHPGAAAAGPSISGPGSAESAGMLPSVRAAIGHFLFVNRLLPGERGGALRGFQLSRRRSERPVRVEWLSAAAVALRADAVRAVDGFDASIFMYGEDIDLCARLSAGGSTLWLLPGARASHEIGGSAPGGTPAWLEGIDGHFQRRRAARARRCTFFVIAAAGLAIRSAGAALASLAWPSEARHEHTRRLSVGALTALGLARRVLADRRHGDA